MVQTISLNMASRLLASESIKVPDHKMMASVTGILSVYKGHSWIQATRGTTPPIPQVQHPALVRPAIS